MKVSVCLASYNGEKYIEEQMLSILSELSATDEVIVSDDGSTDETLLIIESLNDPRITILQNTSEGKGVVNNFERALKQVSGDIIFLADQDDIWLKGKVERCKKALIENILVVTDCIVVDENLNVLHESFFRYRNSSSGLIKNIWKNSYLGCCIAFRKELLETALPFPSKTPMHDIWLGCIAELVGKTEFIKTNYLLYRRHGNNASPTGGESSFSTVEKLKYRICLICSLFLRSFSRPSSGIKPS